MGFSYKSFRVYTVSVPIKGTIFCSSTKISWLSFEKLQIQYMYHPGKNMIMYLKYFAYVPKNKKYVLFWKNVGILVGTKPAV